MTPNNFRVKSGLTVGTTISGGNTTVTGFVNATSSVNAASHTVGTSFIANSIGTTVNVASWGATFRASNSTNFSGIKWEDTGGIIRAGWYRYDNSNLTLSIYDATGTFQAAPIIVSATTGTVTLSTLAATTGTFTGAVSGITTLGTGNTTVTGFVNATASVNSAILSVGTSFVANTTRVVVGTSTGLQANGGIGTAGQTLHSNGTTIYWAADDGITSIATANGLSGGTITTSGTLGVTTGSTLTVNTTGIHVNSNLSIADLTLSGNLTVSGTRTYVNTTTLDVGDNIITLNADLGANPPTENAGLEIMRGTSSNVQFLWDETNDRWTTNGQPIAVSSLVAAGAASGITTLAAGNTTITGFANVSVSVNSAAFTVGTTTIANTTGVYATFVNSKTEGNLNVNTAVFSNTILVPDTRNTNTTPETITAPQVKFDFKANATENLSDGGTYFGEMSFRPYGSSTDWSGGPAHQLGFTSNNNIYHRSGNNTTWGSWGRLYKEGTVLTPAANVAMANNNVTNPVLTGYTEAEVANTSVTGTFTMNCLTANFFDLTLTGNTTISPSNVPPSTRVWSGSIAAKQDATGGRTITWPAGTKYAGGVAPPATTTANALDIWSLMTYDGGSTWIVSLSVKGVA